MSADNTLVWFDCAGKRLGATAGIADYTNPSLSPDGKRLAVDIRNPSTGKRDLWVFTLLGSAPFWSADGARIAFTSDRRGARDIYVKNASGLGEDQLLLESSINKNLEDWSRDGRSLILNEPIPHADDDLFAFSLDTRKLLDLVRTGFNEDCGRLSPDGRWLAYQSDETGRAEVYIQTFPPYGGKWQISTARGGGPQWRGDGKELYYSTITEPARMMAVDIAVKNNVIAAGVPRHLFDLDLASSGARNR